MNYIDIPSNESGLPFALEQYYKELNEIVGERSGQPILLNNTITTFDIDPDAPFYSEEVFRLFADRKYNVSPMDLGTAIQADRFSHRYEDVIQLAMNQIDTDVNSEINQKIKNYLNEIRRVKKELQEYDLKVNEDWNIIAESENLKPGDSKYELRRLNYLERIFYADVMKEFESDIQNYRVLISKLRNSAYSPDEQKLVRSFEELAETYKIARPWNSNFEKTVPGVNILTFADPKVRSKQLCDISPACFPAGFDLVRFQQGKENPRVLKVSETTIHNELHKKTWKGSASAKFNLFGMRLGGGGSSSESSYYRKNFSSIKSFEIKFADLTEVYVDRGLWFDPSLFQSDELKEILNRIPGTRELKYVSVSLIIARGLTVKLKFDEVLEKEQWTKKKFKARGGVSILGIKFGGGGSGSSTKYDYDYKLSEDHKEVTFEDDPKSCRLLGVRLEKIFEPQVDESNIKSLEFYRQHKDFEKLITGKTSYSEYQKNRING